MHCIQSLVTAATPEGTFWSLNHSSFKGPEVFWRKTFLLDVQAKDTSGQGSVDIGMTLPEKSKKKNKRETVWEGTHLAFSQIF